jgi:hypothetical protein
MTRPVRNGRNYRKITKMTEMSREYFFARPSTGDANATVPVPSGRPTPR